MTDNNAVQMSERLTIKMSAELYDRIDTFIEKQIVRPDKSATVRMAIEEFLDLHDC